MPTSPQDAERFMAELGKLKAEKEKLDAEKQKLEADQNPAEATAPRAFAELAKLKAEQKKLDAEKQKLEADQNPAETTSPRAFAELAKLKSERGKLDAEKQKLEADQDPAEATAPRAFAELAKLKAEKKKLETDGRLEWVKTIGAFLIGVGAILTFGLGYCTRLDEKDARQRSDVARLVENLGNEKPQVRSAAAVGLRSFLDNKETRALVIDSLAFGRGLEKQPEVQQAMAGSLASVGAQAADPLRNMIARIEAEVRDDFNKLGPSANCSHGGKEFEPKAKQNAMFVGITALAQIEHKSLDFAEHNFKCFSFTDVPMSFRGANFRGTRLWQADFYGSDLRDSDFSGVLGLGAQFQRAMLEGAIFDGADLDGADFSNASGLSEQQLRRAKSMICAKLDKNLADKFANETMPPPGSGCPR